MAKSKYAPALFEVMASQKTAKPTSRRNVPKWWKSLRGRSAPAPAPEAPPQAQSLTEKEDTESDRVGEIPPRPPVTAEAGVVAEAPEAPAVAARSVVVEPAPASEAAAGPTPPGAKPVDLPAASSKPASPTVTKGIDLFGESEAKPIFRTDSGRIEISLSPVTAAVAAGVLLLALFTSYQVGRGFAPADKHMAQAPTPGSVEDALNKTPNPDALKVGGPTPAASGTGTGGAPTPSAATGGQTGELNPELNYVILDNYGENRDAAEHVQKWLAEVHGIETLLKVKGGKLVLISAKGFNYRDEAERRKCDEYVERIKSLGPECMKELGKARLPQYGFVEPLVARLKG